MSTFHAHSPGLGGGAVDASKTAVVFIEYQNEFAVKGGKMHDAVKGTMGDMLEKSAAVAAAARAAGATVMHTPIIFKADGSDNPNKGLGILAGCADGKLFTEGTWNAEFCAAMTPQVGDSYLSHIMCTTRNPCGWPTWLRSLPQPDAHRQAWSGRSGIEVTCWGLHTRNGHTGACVLPEEAGKRGRAPNPRSPMLTLALSLAL